MNHIRRAMLAASTLLLIVGGCTNPRKSWTTADFERPQWASESQLSQESSSEEASYAHAVALEREDDPECVEWYLRTAAMLWPVVATNHSEESQERQTSLYHSSVGKLIETAQRYGQFDPNTGIGLADTETGIEAVLSASKKTGESVLPLRFHGFTWAPSSFERIEVVGDYRTPDIIHAHRQAGIGVPLLVQHTSTRPFVYPHATFVATAILREERSDTNKDNALVLDIVNPLAIRNVDVEQTSQPVAYDLTAHVAYLSVNKDRQWLKGLLRPEEVEAGLTMIEPYQPGKVPVVFVHGLASDPMTWAAMANELFVYPDLLEHFQFWMFSYPTGKPFPNGAATLRRELVALREHIDPARNDPALDSMVLIGHSMGGLISKLQVTSSGDQLSKSIFKIPFDNLEMNDDMRAKLSDLLFFEPSDQISRVIFIGTPHRGSKLANSAGSVTSRLIRQSGDLVDQCTEFVQLNRDALVTPTKRLPTSVDLLKPGNPVLEAVFSLLIDPRVTSHSIIGTGKSRLGKQAGDGVVPLSSARHPGVASELLVDADHGLHHDRETILEVVRILRRHLTEVDQVGTVSYAQIAPAIKSSAVNGDGPYDWLPLEN